MRTSLAIEADRRGAPASVTGGSGLVGVSDGPMSLLVREADRTWVSAAIARHGSLSGFARGRRDTRPLGGRGPAVLLSTPTGPQVLRPYVRGGMARPILKDRYLRLGEARPLREVRISEALRKLGIATPEIVASATYSRGPFVRAELLTRYVDGSTTLGAEMDAGDGIDRAAAGLLSVGVLLVGMARAGLHHPDLHPGNVLISQDPSGPKAWILDLDRCSLQPERSPERVLDGLRSRLLRALYKWARVRRTTLHPELHTALETGIQAGSR